MTRFFKTLTLSAVALSLALPAVAAPAAPSLPQGGQLRPFNFPAWQEVRLKNGLDVVLVEQHEQPVISMSLIAKSGGSIRDPKGKAGLASLAGSLWSKEAQGRNADQIAEAFDFVGASLSSSAGRDFASLSTKFVSRHLNTVLPLFAEVATRPGFSQAEFDLLKRNRLAGLKQQQDQVGTLASQALYKGIFGDHPFGILPQGTETSVKGISLGDVRQFAKTHYLPKDALLVVAGDFSARALVPQLEKAFGQWQGGMTTAGKPATVPAPKPTRITLIDKPGAVQSALAVGTIGPTYRDADYFPMLVANAVLGGNFISRLNSNLREDKGYTYGAGSRVAPMQTTGLFFARAEVETSVTGPALAEMLKEIRRMGTDPISDTEFTAAKESLIGEFPLSLETADAIAGWVVNQKLYGLGSDYVRTYREQLAKVTLAQAQAAYRKLISPEHLVVVVAGDAKRTSADLAKLAPVETMDLAKLQ